jgi:hypothetical protein
VRLKENTTTASIVNAPFKFFRNTSYKITYVSATRRQPPMDGNNVENTTVTFLGSIVHALPTYAENIARDSLSFFPYLINETPITSALTDGCHLSGSNSVVTVTIW